MTIIKMMQKEEKAKLAASRHKRAMMYAALEEQRAIAVGNHWFDIVNSLQSTMNVILKQVKDLDSILRAVR